MTDKQKAICILLLGVLAAWLLPGQSVGQWSLTGQQAVTTGAVSLANHNARAVCVKATSTNSISIFVGTSSSVTTSTGYELAAHESACFSVTNTNQVYVIAASGGASVSWFTTNQ